MITIENETQEQMRLSGSKFVQFIHKANKAFEDMFHGDRMFGTPIFEGRTERGDQMVQGHAVGGHSIEDYPEVWILYLPDGAAFFPKTLRAYEALRKAYQDVTDGLLWEDNYGGTL